jgi:hypothetical protein
MARETRSTTYSGVGSIGTTTGPRQVQYQFVCTGDVEVRNGRVIGGVVGRRCAGTVAPVGGGLRFGNGQFELSLDSGEVWRVEHDNGQWLRIAS